MTAIFILSLDTEIAWGTYHNLAARAPAFERYPELLRRLIQQLNIYEIPATWALVGHLLLPIGTKTDVPQPHYRFSAVPDAQRVAAHPSHWFHAPYILESILKMRTPQEIGTHTFTHVLATEPSVSAALFDAQLAEVVHIHRQHGLPVPRSLVYPQNRIAHTALLRKHGIITYRGEAPNWTQRLPKPLRRPANLLDYLLALTPPTLAPSACPLVDGVLNIPASQFLMSYDGIRKQIPTGARVLQAQRGLAQAVARGEIFHLWFHPFNLGSSDAMFDALAQILALVWALREQGKLQTLSMADAAAQILASRIGGEPRVNNH